MTLELFDRSITFTRPPWVTALARGRRDARPPEMQKFAHAIQALQTLVLLRAGAKLQLPRLTLHHNLISHAVRLWELTRPASPAPLATEIALGPFYGTAAV